MTTRKQVDAMHGHFKGRPLSMDDQQRAANGQFGSGSGTSSGGGGSKEKEAKRIASLPAKPGANAGHEEVKAYNSAVAKSLGIKPTSAKAKATAKKLEAGAAKAKEAKRIASLPPKPGKNATEAENRTYNMAVAKSMGLA